jgi:hypothetical protein
MAGVPVGSSMPTIEGLLLAACIHWLPRLFAHSPHYVQNAMGIVLLAWMVTFLAMFLRLVLSGNMWCKWHNFSFFVLFARNLTEPGDFGPTRKNTRQDYLYQAKE